MVGVKKVDCALLPPCARTLHKKIQRAHFISNVWGNADSPYPDQGMNPVDFGWKLNNGFYIPEWFLGPHLPNDILLEVEDHQSNEPDVEPEVDDSELPWSDDSECENDM